MFSIPPTIPAASLDLKGFHTLYSILSPVSLIYILGKPIRLVLILNDSLIELKVIRMA
jgi:hypothetical protein